ncbi:MAG: phage portal protein [Bacillota bacterium]|nr:phage portal protein [Bacillota bacterium]
MVTSNPDIIKNGIPDIQAVENLLRQFDAGAIRLSRLKRYYEGQHDILSRTRLSGLPNNRLSHAYPRYIAQVSAAYLLGEPVRVEGPEPGATALRGLLLRASADSIDIDLAIDQAVYGRAVSLCYEEKGYLPYVCALNPQNAFVVYDDTVAHDPLFGVYLTGLGKDRQITVYTDRAVITWPKADKKPLIRPHPFQSLPMVEYRNGADAHGDFEDVLTLIDAYNLLSCDRLNDRQQFSDALLVLTGVMGIDVMGGDGLNAMERLRQEKTLALPDASSRAEWLVKNPQERDIEVLRGALKEDIHKFSMTPDFSDERFSGNSSGIAIKYKLFNFDNRIKLKERYFITGLRERARAFCGWLKTREGISLNADELVFKLSRRLPVNELERAQCIRALSGILEEETLRFNSPLQDDPNRPLGTQKGEGVVQT